MSSTDKLERIPKIIHYCWFGGGGKSEKILRCMDTWRKHMPDYEIKEWNEDNCDIAGSVYAKSAYAAKKWAFVADYFRFKVLYENGGIYLDTDVYINKPLDDFLCCNTFFPMECYQLVNGTTVGTAPESEVIKKLLDTYNKEYDPAEGTICKRITDVLLEDYGYLQTGYTQYLKDDIAVFSPNILIVDVDDGQNYCEHLYDRNVSWWNETLNNTKEGNSWKYVVLEKYFYNKLGRPPQYAKQVKLNKDSVSSCMETVTELLACTAPLLEQLDALPAETATELYGMYNQASYTISEFASHVNTDLRVKLCAAQDNLLERIVDDIPALNIPYKNIYSPAINTSKRWSNVELMKDSGLAVYMLGKYTGMHPVLFFGKQSESFPYLDDMTGLEVLKTDTPPGDMSEYYRHLADNCNSMDLLAMHGMFAGVPGNNPPDTAFYINMYRALRPDGRIYLALDMNSHWMNIIPWGSEEVLKAVSGCDVIATSCRAMRDALNSNPHITFPCRWFANGFYNLANVPIVTDADKKENIILTVGRIGTPVKNNLELMNAFSMIANSIPDWKLYLVGPIEEAFKPVIDEYFINNPALKDRVIFTGALTGKTELYAQYSKAKIFAITSWNEGGTPNVYAEALVHGCMFVTTCVNGADDITNYGQLGMKYKIGDTPALGNALLKMCNNADSKALEEHIPLALAYWKRYYDWERNAKKLAYMLFNSPFHPVP